MPTKWHSDHLPAVPSGAPMISIQHLELRQDRHVPFNMRGGSMRDLGTPPDWLLPE